MTIKNIVKALKKLDCVIIRENEREMFAMGHGYDIEVVGGHILTVRKTKNRGEYDQGSDYNPGGYIFLRRIKDLNHYLTN